MPWDEIWETLEMEETRDKRAIKRAYGKMVAKFHPEEHPEMFQKVRDAYEAALSYADNGYVAMSDVYEWEAFDDRELFMPSENRTSIFSEALSQAEKELIAKEEAQKLAAEEATAVYEGLLRRQFKGAELDDFLASQIFQDVRRNDWFIMNLINLSYEHGWGNFLTQVHLAKIKAAFGLNGFVFDDSENLQMLASWLNDWDVYFEEHFLYKNSESLHQSLVVDVYRAVRLYLLNLAIVAVASVIAYDVGDEWGEFAVTFLTLGILIYAVVGFIWRARKHKGADDFVQETRFAVMITLCLAALIGLAGFNFWIGIPLLFDNYAFVRMIFFGFSLVAYIWFYVKGRDVTAPKDKLLIRFTAKCIFAVRDGHAVGVWFFVKLVALFIVMSMLLDTSSRVAIDHTWRFTSPWTLEWVADTISLYPEQALELERRFDWTVQRQLFQLYDQAFRTDDRILMRNGTFEPVDLLYYAVDDPENEVRVRMYFVWEDEQAEAESDRRFLLPDMHVRLEVPFEQLFLHVPMEFAMQGGVLINSNFEQEIHDVIIPFLSEVLGFQMMNHQNHNLRERGTDDMLFLYYRVDHEDGLNQLWGVRVVPVWGSDEGFAISCWFSYHEDEVDAQYCD